MWGEAFEQVGTFRGPTKLTYDGEHHHFFAYLRASLGEVNGTTSESPMILELVVLCGYRCSVGLSKPEFVYAYLLTGIVVSMFWCAIVPTCTVKCLNEVFECYVIIPMVVSICLVVQTLGGNLAFAPSTGSDSAATCIAQNQNAGHGRRNAQVVV